MTGGPDVGGRPADGPQIPWDRLATGGAILLLFGSGADLPDAPRCGYRPNGGRSRCLRDDGHDGPHAYFQS